jgi:magnesium-transporting ATPase (P-type)
MYLLYINSSVSYDDTQDHESWLKNVEGVKRVGLVLDGETLEFCTEHYWDEIMPLLTRCDSVIVCRASPLQKEKVVNNVKRYQKKAVTLAIGQQHNKLPYKESL